MTWVNMREKERESIFIFLILEITVLLLGLVLTYINLYVSMILGHAGLILLFFIIFKTVVIIEREEIEQIVQYCKDEYVFDELKDAKSIFNDPVLKKREKKTSRFVFLSKIFIIVTIITFFVRFDNLLFYLIVISIDMLVMIIKIFPLMNEMEKMDIIKNRLKQMIDIDNQD